MSFGKVDCGVLWRLRFLLEFEILCFADYDRFVCFVFGLLLFGIWFPTLVEFVDL